MEEATMKLFSFRTDVRLAKSASALILAAAMIVTTTACNTAQILGYLQQVAPTVIAVLNLAAAFGGPAMSTSQEQAINNEAASVIDLYNKWQSASTAAKPDALSQFNAAYKVFAQNVQQVLNTIRVVDPQKQALIQAAVG